MNDGWVGYFRLADMGALLAEVDAWCRRKVRCVYWKCWKRVRTRFRELMRLGIERETAFSWACSRKGPFRVAGSGILDRALSNAVLEKEGWPMFLPRYLELQCQV